MAHKNEKKVNQHHKIKVCHHVLGTTPCPLKFHLKSIEYGGSKTFLVNILVANGLRHCIFVMNYPKYIALVSDTNFDRLNSDLVISTCSISVY